MELKWKETPSGMVDAEGTYVYYLRSFVKRDPGKIHPFGCVVLYPDSEGRVHRGISVCSDEDPFEYREARKRAFDRLAEAVKEEKSDGTVSRIGNSHREYLKSLGFKYLQGWNVEINRYEKEMLKESF